LIHRVPQDHESIQAAVDSSGIGDTVLVARGHYPGLLILSHKELLLCSEHLFSGDSLDVQETILDGEGQGCVLTLRDTSDCAIHGFTLTGGISYVDGETMQDMRMAAASVVLGSSATFEHLLITGNDGGDHPYALGYGMYSLSGDMTFHNCIFRNNSGSGDAVYQLAEEGYANLFMMDSCEFSEPPVDNSGYITGIARSCRVTNSSFTGAWSTPLYLIGLDSLLLENLYIGHNRAESISYSAISAGGGSKLIARNILVEDCRRSSFSSLGGETMWLGARDSLIVENVEIRDCQNLSWDEAVEFRCANLPDDPNPVASARISNLFFHHNVSGATGHEFMDPFGKHVGLPCKEVLLDHCRFTDNTSIIYSPEHTMRVVGALVSTNGTLDTRIVDCEFSRNHVNVADNSTTEWIHHGRALFVDAVWWDFGGPHQPGRTLIDGCIFDQQTVDEIAIDVWEWPLPSHVVDVNPVSGEVKAGPTTLRDCLFRDCDDGGIYIYGQDSISIENCRFERIGRCFTSIATVDDVDPPVRFRNCLFKDLFNQSPLPPVAGDVAFDLRVGDALFENCSILGNGTPGYPSSMFAFDYDPGGHSFALRNCVVWDNHFGQVFQLDEPSTFITEYCDTQYDWPGTGNFAADPLYEVDPDLGVVFPAASPCVDAGDPDPAYHDLEDPENPGMALPPAQGTLRNDVGHWGGGAVSDHWTYLDRFEKPECHPQGFLLGHPYPNPFNPACWLPLRLERPERLRISVYDLLGRRVRRLLDGLLPAGEHRLVLDGTGLASGVYVIQLEGERNSVESRKVILAR